MSLLCNALPCSHASSTFSSFFATSFHLFFSPLFSLFFFFASQWRVGLHRRPQKVLVAPIGARNGGGKGLWRERGLQLCNKEEEEERRFPQERESRWKGEDATKKSYTAQYIRNPQLIAYKWINRSNRFHWSIKDIHYFFRECRVYISSKFKKPYS